MNITVKKLTDVALLREACATTAGKENSKATLRGLYRCEHSPIRTQLFWVMMKDIPTFVSVHFVRHKVGVEHFVRTNREDLVDRGARKDEGRETPCDHAMLVNAQTLINMARKRLCAKAHKKTIAVMAEIVKKVAEVDSHLVEFLVPECDYRGGYCHEFKSCGRKPSAA